MKSMQCCLCLAGVRKNILHCTVLSHVFSSRTLNIGNGPWDKAVATMLSSIKSLTCEDTESERA